MTKKTLIETVIENRIDHSCNLLKHTDMHVIEVCFDSGFRNISHFNNCFKKLKELSPLRYRKNFLEQEKLAV